MQQKLEVAKLDRYFYRKLRICLKHLQNTKVDYNRLPLSCIRSVEC